EAVTDLAAGVGMEDGGIVLDWTSTGNDGASGALLAGSSFYIQYSTFDLTWSTMDAQVALATSNVNAGELQRCVLPALNPGSTYYLRLWTSDESGNCSALSNGTTNWAQDLALSSPTAVSVGTVEGGQVGLSWTVPPAPAHVDDRALYRVYRATQDFSGVADAGVLLSSEASHPAAAATVTGLWGETTYYFGVTAVDQGDQENGLMSLALEGALSTVVSTRTADVAPGAVSDLTALPGSADGEIRLSWTSPGDDGEAGDLSAGIFLIKFSSVQIINAADFDAPPFAVTSLAVSTNTAALSPATLLVTGLTAGCSYWFAVKTRDEAAGNYSLWNSSGDQAGVNPLAYSAAMDAPPAAPSGLTASSSPAQVDLSWTAGAEPDLSAYEIYQSSWSEAEGFSLLDTVLSSQTDYQKTGLVNGNTYYYKVRAQDQTGHFSDYSSTVSAVPGVALGAAPVFSTSTVVVSSSVLHFVWSLTANADGYRVIQSSSGFSLSGDLGPSASAYSLTGLPVNSSHTVYVRAFSGLQTLDSGTTTHYTFAAVPAGLASPAQTVSSLDLDWVDGGNPPGTRYDVERSSTGVDGWTLRAEKITATTHYDSGLAEYATYYYRVYAVNGAEVRTAAFVGLTTMTAGISPAAVSNLAANPGAADGAVELVWMAPGDDAMSGLASSYVVKYATFDFAAAEFDAGYIHTFTQSWVPKTPGLTEGLSPLREVTGLYPGTTYYFAIKAVDEAGLLGTWSTSGVNLERFGYAQDNVPDSPDGLSASAGNAQITLSWTALSETDLDHYRIYMDSMAPLGDAYTLLGTTPAAFAAYVANGLSNETTYSFKVSGVDQGSSGDFFSHALEGPLSLESSTATW
ncbi:MAG TPA: hypothetical protein P5079_11470, partial [Elusimicrobiota bacterium]|nr:hypothetical protein [Elusimicrobiota bacterium]